jgi:hypothetical protein
MKQTKEPMLLCPDHFQFELEKILVAVNDLHTAFLGYQEFLFSDHPEKVTKPRAKAKKRKTKNATK